MDEYIKNIHINIKMLIYIDIILIYEYKLNNLLFLFNTFYFTTILFFKKFKI